MMLRTVRLLLLAGAMAAATLAVGWWGVPAVGAAWGILTRRQRGRALTAGLAAMLGWAALLGLAAARGPVGTLATELGSVFSLKAVGVYAITLALPCLLALTAAVVARSLAVARA